jgi:hypothetical protein
VLCPWQDATNLHHRANEVKVLERLIAEIYRRPTCITHHQAIAVGDVYLLVRGRKKEVVAVCCDDTGHLVVTEQFAAAWLELLEAV